MDFASFLIGSVELRYKNDSYKISVLNIQYYIKFK